MRLVEYHPLLRRRAANLHTELGRGGFSSAYRYIDWKYGDRPHRTRACMAVEDKLAVGMRGAVELIWQRGGRRCVLWSASDAVVRKGHPSPDLVDAMTNHLCRSFTGPLAPVVCLDVQHASASRHIELGWQSLGCWSVAHRRLTLTRADASQTSSSSRRLPFGGIDRNASAKHGLPKGITMSARPRSSAMARLLRQLPVSPSISPVRDETFYAWRYLHPLSEYRFLFLDAAGLRGFLVLQSPNRSTHSAINVIEWEGTTVNDKALLLEAAMGWGEFDHLSVWSSSFQKNEQGVLERLGFDLIDDRPATPNGVSRPHIFIRPGKPAFRTKLQQLSLWQIPAVTSDNF